ncbi:MAG: hypothetical protein WBP61_19725 [Nocardioides sp.]
MSGARRGSAALAALLGTLAATVVAGGCSSGGAPRDEVDGPPPTATLGFTQLIPLEGTEHALLRVTNTSDEPLAVRSVRLDWAGYPDGEAAAESATLAPDQTLDLRFDLPAPACGPTDGDERSVIGVVETDRGVIRQPLVDASSVYVRRLWRTQCDVAALDRAVGLSFTRGWAVTGEGRDARAEGAIVLERREGDPPIMVASVDGSVLHGLRLPGGTALRPGQDRARIPLEITPGNRCDEHARGQATAPFDFLARLEIAGQRFAVPLEVPLPAMNAATEALDLACAARAQQ